MKEYLEWQGFEYYHTEKGTDWDWALGIIAVSVAVTAILLQDSLFAVVVGLATFILRAAARRKPRFLSYEINTKGIVGGHILYPFETLESFWIIEESRYPKIVLKSKKVILPFIHLPLGTGNPDEIREYLMGNDVAEVEHIEPLSHKIMEYLGF